MKIFVVGHSVAHYRQRKMWEYIAGEGHKVLSICMPVVSEKEKYSPMKTGTYELQIFNPYLSPNPNMWYFPGLHDQVGMFDPDVIMCVQEPLSYFAYNLLSIAKLFRKPFAFFTWENLRKLHPHPWRKMDAEVVKGADLAIAGNNEAGKILLEKGADNVEVALQTGLDKELFVPIPKLKFDNRTDPTKLLYVGRLVPEKGIELILKAFDRLEGDYQLKFVGGRGQMEELIKSHPEFNKKITLEGWTEYTRLPKVYNWGDVILMPSLDIPQWMEQCGYVIGESLLCHVPAITSMSLSIAQIWGQCPDVIMIQQGDIDMLITAIESINPEMEAKKGRQCVIEKYSVETVGNKYIEMLEGII